MKKDDNFIKLISLSWDKALLSFCLDSYAPVKVNCSGGGKSFVSETTEAGLIGRLPLNGLVPDTGYKLMVKWGNKKRLLAFKTLSKPSGKLLSTYAVLADPHVSEKQENRKGRLFVESALILEGVIDECNRCKLDFILIAGDLTNRGTAWEYDRVKEVLARSKCPVLAVPGDHDFHSNGSSRWRASFGPEQWLRDIKEYRIVGLNTGRNILDTAGRKLINKMAKGGRIPIILTHVPLLPNNKIKYGAKSRPVSNYNKEVKYIENICSLPALIYAGHQNVPARVAVGRAVQINLPQPGQYLCGYYQAQHFQNGFYHMFMPIGSEILRQYSRLASNLAADFYHEKQWNSVYREGENVSESNFLIPG